VIRAARPRALRTAIILCLAAATGGCGDVSDVASPADARPNVVVIVLDTVRADALSCYGNTEPLTPHVDAVARDGTRYATTYATCFWTLPSHASLLTGLYPSEAGATSETNHLPEAVETLAERLRRDGYATGAVVRNPWLSVERGFAQGFDVFVEAWRTTEVPEIEAEHAAVGAAVEWMAERAREPAPFFLFVNLNLAHLPYTPSDEALQHVATREWPPDHVERMRGIESGWGHLTGRLELQASDYELLRELYHAEVWLLDAMVGELDRALHELGVADRTVLVVTSDHGENLGEHGRIDHVLSMYEPTVRVPLVIRGPGIPAGDVVTEPVSLVDVTPALLAACSVPDRDASGASRSNGASPFTRDAVYAENRRPVNGVRLLERWFPDFDASSIDHPMRMVRSGSDKLIWTADVGTELYDLDTDPGESLDLSGRRSDRRDDLLAILRQWALGQRPVAGQVPEVAGRDRENLERLRRLGYVE